MLKCLPKSSPFVMFLAFSSNSAVLFFNFSDSGDVSMVYVCEGWDVLACMLACMLARDVYASGDESERCQRIVT